MGHQISNYSHMVQKKKGVVCLFFGTPNFFEVLSLLQDE